MNIKALVQWTKDLIRTGQDPNLNVFDITNNPDLVQELLRRQATFDNWYDKASEKARTTKSKQFDQKVKWID